MMAMIARARSCPCDRIAGAATRALLLELSTWPKPGLVSDRDNGSHDDMDAAMLRASALTLTPFFAELARAGQGTRQGTSPGTGQDACGMNVLREIGLRAEAAMLRATDGVNTHRGAIFGLGLLCAAAGSQPAALGDHVRRRWGREIGEAPVPAHSHGASALRRFGAGGARQEAAKGFPHVYGTALPALRAGRHACPGNEEAARVQACFALIATVEDTNLLHRGGAGGIAFAQKLARGFLDRGGVAQPEWRQQAVAIHEAFVMRRLSPGGSADLLAMTLLVDSLESPSP